jgi:cyclic beta-1,2-glucan synthetase
MGSGDWNDGMNLVGMQGQGESVWLGFFLCEVLRQFAGSRDAYGDLVFAELCRDEGGLLRRNIEQHAWDGGWYRRAWFDDGTALGSAATGMPDRLDLAELVGAVRSGQGRATARVRGRRCRRSTSGWCVASTRSSSFSTRPSTSRTSIPATSGATCRGCGRTAGSTPTERLGGDGLCRTRRGRARLGVADHDQPGEHSLSAAGAATYKVEPYVVAADVYALSPHIGRGGWSWYTGSAGWMYRLIVESLLGLRRHGEQLRLAPCLPRDWPGFSIRYRYRETTYHITVTQTRADAALQSGVTRVTVDGVEHDDQAIALLDDHREHRVEVSVRAQ